MCLISINNGYYSNINLCNEVMKVLMAVYNNNQCNVISNIYY